MRKVITFILCISIVVITTISAYALSITENEAEAFMVELKMTSNEEEIEFMKEFNNGFDCDYNDFSNGIKLNITNEEKKDNKIFIAGEGILNLNGYEMNFYFEKQQIFKTMSEGKVLYDGSVEVILSFGNNDVDGILDLTMEDNYTDAVISLTLKNPSDGTQIILLFGDTFESQIAYSKQIAEEYTLSLASYKNETASIV